jgi:hypothetical protein
MLTGMRPRSQRAAIVVLCILAGLLAATAVITVVAAQNAGTKPTVRPYIASMPPAKQTYAALGQTKTAEFATTHPEAKNIPSTATHGPSIQGLARKYPNPSNMNLPIENEWYGAINGRGVALYAGYFAITYPDGREVRDEQQGYIAVDIGPATPGPGQNYHEYLTPTKHGALEITAVDGTKVSLVAKDGAIFTFDLDTSIFA